MFVYHFHFNPRKRTRPGGTPALWGVMAGTMVFDTPEHGALLCLPDLDQAGRCRRWVPSPR
jgi:hypothetical protein